MTEGVLFLDLHVSGNQIVPTWGCLHLLSAFILFSDISRCISSGTIRTEVSPSTVLFCVPCKVILLLHYQANWSVCSCMEISLYIVGAWFVPKCRTWKTFLALPNYRRPHVLAKFCSKSTKSRYIFLLKCLPNLVKVRQGKLCLSKAQNKRLILTHTMVGFVKHYGSLGATVQIDLRQMLVHSDI